MMTLILLPLNLGHATDYVVLYLGLVSVLAITSGLISALLAAGVSFVLVDYFFGRLRRTTERQTTLTPPGTAP